MTTSSGVINNVIEHLFQDIAKVKRELMLLQIKAAEFSGFHNNNMHDRFKSKAQEDKDKIMELTKSKLLTSIPRNLNFKEELNKVINNYVILEICTVLYFNRHFLVLI